MSARKMYHIRRATNDDGEFYPFGRDFDKKEFDCRKKYLKRSGIDFDRVRLFGDDENLGLRICLWFVDSGFELAVFVGDGHIATIDLGDLLYGCVQASLRVQKTVPEEVEETKEGLLQLRNTCKGLLATLKEHTIPGRNGG